jgi:Fe2+ transport system protein FeoA
LIRANNLYDRKDEFLALGLDDTVRSPLGFDTVYSALRAYKAVYGDLLVPQKFVVPQGDVRFPVETWGLKLGHNVHTIRYYGIYSEHRTKLEELGLNFEVDKNQHYDFLTQIYPALEVYKAVNGNLLVPVKFVILEGDLRFPVDTWGMKLGIIVHNIRSHGDFLKYRERLTALGFSYEIKPLDIRGFDVIYSAFEAYKAVNGDLLVPQKFVVPHGDVKFPPDTWGMKLGHSVMSIRNQGAYSEHKVKLEELGFVYGSVFDVQFDLIYSALEAYKAVNGDLLVPRTFVVPEGDVSFPPETWGMKLGSKVKSIRNRGDYSEHKVKLEELGFVYKKKNQKV